MPRVLVVARVLQVCRPDLGILFVVGSSADEFGSFPSSWIYEILDGLCYDF